MARKPLFRREQVLDIHKPLVAQKAMNISGRSIAPGDSFDLSKLLLTPRRVDVLFRGGFIAHPEDQEAGSPTTTKDTLVGSNILPSIITLANGTEVQLGALVARAHKASGMSIPRWNRQSEDELEIKLADELEKWNVEVAPPAGAGEKQPSEDAGAGDTGGGTGESHPPVNAPAGEVKAVTYEAKHMGAGRRLVVDSEGKEYRPNGPGSFFPSKDAALAFIATLQQPAT